MENQEEVARLQDLQRERTEQFERDKEELNKQLVSAQPCSTLCHSISNVYLMHNPKAATNALIDEEATLNIKLSR